MSTPNEGVQILQRILFWVVLVLLGIGLLFGNMIDMIGLIFIVAIVFLILMLIV